MGLSFVLSKDAWSQQGHSESLTTNGTSQNSQLKRDGQPTEC